MTEHILFHLNKEIVLDVEELDYDYIATQDKNNPEITYVTWIEGEELMEEDYPTSQVEDYFEKGYWIEVI